MDAWLVVPYFMQSFSGLNEVIPVDAHLIASNRLFISITVLPTFRNEVVFQFVSREDLIGALVASCHLPVYAHW